MLEEFFKAVLPASGYYCLVLLPEGQHLWVDSVDKLAQMAQRVANRQGVYFATASFKTSENRKSANVLALKALRLDIDAGEKKYAKDPKGTYPNQREALQALVGFVKSSAITPSYIVSSGEGLHVYYCLDTELEPEDWLPIAEGLRQATLSHGLRVDPTVTCDTARILRPLGGLHSGKRRVEVLRATGAVHSQASLTQALDVLPKPRKYDTSINDDAIASVEGPPSSALKIVKHCAALKGVVDELGDVQEPYWRAMLGLVKFTVEGDEQAHEWSKGYHGYSERETDRKLQSWETGPASCVEFSKHTDACDGCKHKGKIKSPIVLGRMTSDQIETLPDEQRPAPPPPPVVKGMAWDGNIPQGFDVVTKDGENLLIGYIETERESETGETIPVRIRVPITNEVFWFSHWADAENEGDGGAQVTVHKWDDMDARVKAYTMPLSLLATKADLAKKLAEFGILTTTDKRAATAMESYTKAQHLRIKNLFRRPKISDRFGMRVLDDGQLVAVHGKYVIYGDGRIQAGAIGPRLRGTVDSFALPVPPNFLGEWEPSVWDTHILPAAQRHVDFMRDSYGAPGMEKYQLAFMLGLCSPLMAFVTGSYSTPSELPANGLSVSLYERQGGRGKTTLMQSTVLAYGRPEELAKDQNQASSTDLARTAKLSIWGTMPAAFDEMGRNSEKSATSLISAVANGSSRERLTKNGDLQSGGRWALICLVATNKSHRDMITVNEEESAAVQYRLLELDINDMPDFTQEQRNSFAQRWADIRDTAGALGAAIQRELCAMGPVRVNKLVMECVAKAGTLVDADKEDRFQYRALGAMLATQLILRKLGFEMFDTKRLLACFREANDSAKHYIQENTTSSNGLDLLEMFLYDIRGNTVITEDIGITRTRGQKSYAVHIHQRFPDKVFARYIKNQWKIYVAADALGDWCRNKGIRATEITDLCRTVGVLEAVDSGAKAGDKLVRIKRRYNLLTGMRENTETSVSCIAFDMRKLALHRGRGVIDALDSFGDEDAEAKQAV
jgi:hypothetical protein